MSEDALVVLIELYAEQAKRGAPPEETEATMSRIRLEHWRRTERAAGRPD